MFRAKILRADERENDDALLQGSVQYDKLKYNATKTIVIFDEGEYIS